jgi:hypothetical protein
LRTLADALQERDCLEAHERYIGIDSPEFHAIVSAYWNADLAAGAALFSIRATKFTDDLIFEDQHLHASLMIQAHRATRKKQAKTKYTEIVNTLEDSVLELHRGAEAYIRGDSPPPPVAMRAAE